MNIIIFGIGDTGKKFFDKFQINQKDRIIAFVDNNEKLWNTSYKGIPVISPKMIGEVSFDCIVVASIYAESIIEQIYNMNIDTKIIKSEDYIRCLYTQKIYKQRYSTNNKKKTIFDNDIVVYTAITGDYDQLNDPVLLNPGIKYICYTNNYNLKSNIWEIRYISDDRLDDMYLAKRVKLFPNEYINESNTSVWIDGKFQVIGNLKEYIDLFQKEEPMLCFPHFERNCIYEEAAKCIVDGIGIKKDIINQITHYRTQGYPLSNGLYEAGCLVRKHNDSTIKKIMYDWWEEINRFSYRDQISLPYVFWKNDFLPDICDQNLYSNKWVLCKRGYSKQMNKNRM